MIKIITTLCIASISSFAMAQQIPTQLQKFIPQHWEIVALANGDLNSDGLTDTVVIIQPKNHKIMDRKLLVLINKGNALQQMLVKKIPEWSYRDNENCTDDALNEDSVKINRSLLNITFNGMNNCSNWYGDSWTYRFKISNEQFKLIGFEYWFTYKTDGKATRHSGNFLTQKLKTTIYNEFDDQVKPKITWKKLSPISPNTLEKIQFKDDQNFLKQMFK